MKKYLPCIMIMFFSGMFCSGVLEQPDEFATITFFVGDVKKNAAEVQIGEILNENDLILTGTGASCDLKIGDSMIRIKENSKVQMSQILRGKDAESVTLSLNVGKILCRPKKLLKNENFLVRTPTAVAGVRGTIFTVEADSKKTTRIKVFNGKVNVVRRVDKLEEKIGITKILEETAPIAQNEKVVITAEEVRAAEAKVEKALVAKSGDGPVVDDKGISRAVAAVAVATRDVHRFKVEEFRQEKEEFISVVQRSPEVITAVKRVIKRESKTPMPDGSLLVTRHDIFFIKNGKVEGEWKTIGAPVRKNENIYIASKDYVFCASIEGPVMWRKKISNDGKLEIKQDELFVYIGGGARKLDLKTGEILE